MKTYEIELKRVSYVTLTIEADSTEEAKQKAWEDIERGYNEDGSIDWDVESIEELT